ncbi:Yox1p [Sugiyamaella lignohabitans]|uniref:Yox1p n=1 Tax=Sugiyamaella lignohabitans TaxID=796027 RepID=A0A167FF01_9ASCO|nr:Yox1p [Sugiyamaella lignohabitans]ANB15215.1 Yox1p [Sugiyamaella lignohabitans]
MEVITDQGIQIQSQEPQRNMLKHDMVAIDRTLDNKNLASSLLTPPTSIATSPSKCDLLNEDNELSFQNHEAHHISDSNGVHHNNYPALLVTPQDTAYPEVSYNNGSIIEQPTDTLPFTGTKLCLSEFNLNQERRDTLLPVTMPNSGIQASQGPLTPPPPRCRLPFEERKPKKRKRTTAAQLAYLESHFDYCAKPPMWVRERISQSIGMTEKAVNIWYQNRRQACRRNPEKQLGSGEYPQSTSLDIGGISGIETLDANYLPMPPVLGPGRYNQTMPLQPWVQPNISNFPLQQPLPPPPPPQNPLSTNQTHAYYWPHPA